MIRRQSGRGETIRPAQVVEGLGGDDPVVAIDWPRADLRLATYEFLIGLLATLTPPVDEAQWQKWWSDAPSVAVLDAAFAPARDAFWLDRPGPCFMQDHATLDSGVEPIERLLIEKCNAEFLVHPLAEAAYARGVAAIALFALQAWAPAGGRGNMTGMRGGGPLLTLVMPGEGAALWDMLWANVPCGERAKPADYRTIFPWMAPTVGSGPDGRKVHCGQDAHPLQCYWGMPRRIRLTFETLADGVCALTGERPGVFATGWRQRPYGASYANWTGLPYEPDATMHPLTPRYRQKPGAEWFSVHPQPGGIGYRHWVGLVVVSPGGLAEPASVVSRWREERARGGGMGNGGDDGTRLFCAGYDMDNMKARGFVESEMPLPGSADPEHQTRVDELTRQMVESAGLTADILRACVREALFGKGTVGVDVSTLANLRARFWEQTERPFFERLDEAVAADADLDPLRRAWSQVLGRTAREMFDEVVQIGPETGLEAARRAFQARRRIVVMASGAGKDGAALARALDLPVPVAGEPARQRKSA